MNAEEFILIPKQMYLKQRPLTEQIIQNPQIKEKGMQLSMLQRLQHPNKTLPDHLLDETITSENVKETVFDQLKTLKAAQLTRSEYIFETLIKNSRVSIDNNGGILIDGTSTGVNASTFLYNLQQPTKNIEIPLYTNIITQLNIPEHLVPNTNAKKIIQTVGKTTTGGTTWTSIRK